MNKGTENRQTEQDNVQDGVQNGVQYRRAKTWRIALSQMNSAAGMCFYILLGYASYLANTGYGVATAVVGLILTGTRIFDGITDPLIALLIDKTNTKFGKMRIFIVGGWLIESLAVLLLYVWCSGKGHGIVLFILLYMLYIIGYTMNNVTAQIIGPVMTNDPKQRPVIGVWGTVYNYLAPMILSMVITVVLLPRYGNEFNVPMLSASCLVCVSMSFVMVVLCCIAISNVDKPENFCGIRAKEKKQPVSLRDMWHLLKENRCLQMYIVSAASDKLAQQTSSQAIVTTMLYGILIGNMQISSIIGVVAMLPSILFAIFGARYAGKHGNKEAVVTWTRVCTGIAAVSVLFFCLTDTRQITVALAPTVVFFVLTLLMNGAKMCVTTATGAMCADVIDYELNRSGKYLPAAVTATYSFIDKLISSTGAAIATGCVALIGYTSTMPQPNDLLTTPVLVMTMCLFYGMPMLGWICTLVAMKFCPLSRETMVEVQRSIQEKRKAEG